MAEKELEGSRQRRSYGVERAVPQYFPGLEPDELFDGINGVPGRCFSESRKDVSPGKEVPARRRREGGKDPASCLFQIPDQVFEPISVKTGRSRPIPVFKSGRGGPAPSQRRRRGEKRQGDET